MVSVLQANCNTMCKHTSVSLKFTFTLDYFMHSHTYIAKHIKANLVRFQNVSAFNDSCSAKDP